MGDAKENKTTRKLLTICLRNHCSKNKNTTSLLFGFPNGHIFDNRPLIIGSKVKMEVEEKGLVKFYKPQ